MINYGQRKMTRFQFIYSAKFIFFSWNQKKLDEALMLQSEENKKNGIRGHGTSVLQIASMA